MKKLLFILLISSILRGMQKQTVIDGKLRNITRYNYFDEDDKTEKSIDIIEDLQEPIAEENKIKKNICKLCNKSFKAKESLLRHLSSIHEKIKENKCDKCEYASGDSTSLKFHKFKKHGEGTKYTCTQANCGKFFFSPSLLKIHGRVHKEERPFVCQFCGGSFKQQGNCNRHEDLYCKENKSIKRLKKK